MRGFELRAKFYPLVPTLARLAEEAQEGVGYPFTVRQVLQLQNKEYRQLCKALDKGYGFERMLPEEGYDPVYGSFICVLVTTAARKQGILMARSYNTLFGAFSAGLHTAGSGKCAVPANPAGYAQTASTRGRPLTAKRKRQHQIALRLNDQELRHLNRQSNLSGLSREAYIRGMIMALSSTHAPAPTTLTCSARWRVFATTPTSLPTEPMLPAWPGRRAWTR